MCGDPGAGPLLVELNHPHQHLALLTEHIVDGGDSFANAPGHPRQVYMVELPRLPPLDRRGERVEHRVPAVVVVGVDERLVPRPLQRVPPPLPAQGTRSTGAVITATPPTPWGCGCPAPGRGTRKTCAGRRGSRLGAGPLGATGATPTPHQRAAAEEGGLPGQRVAAIAVARGVYAAQPDVGTEGRGGGGQGPAQASPVSRMSHRRPPTARGPGRRRRHRPYRRRACLPCHAPHPRAPRRRQRRCAPGPPSRPPGCQGGDTARP